MGGRNLSPLRSLPRAFVTGVPDPADERLELPREEYEKFHKVLRLGTGDQVAILPGDGRIVRCTLEGRDCRPIETIRPETERRLRLTLALALSKPDPLESAVRMATELGADGFVLFASDRSVVKWDGEKSAQKTERLKKIAREAAEVSFRTHLPSFQWKSSLKEVLTAFQGLIVLSESETTLAPFVAQKGAGQMAVAIGPEGGWSPREQTLITDRAATLGPLVLRVDTAVAAACSLLLIEP